MGNLFFSYSTNLRKFKIRTFVILEFCRFLKQQMALFQAIQTSPFENVHLNNVVGQEV